MTEAEDGAQINKNQGRFRRWNYWIGRYDFISELNNEKIYPITIVYISDSKGN